LANGSGHRGRGKQQKRCRWRHTHGNRNSPAPAYCTAYDVVLILKEDVFYDVRVAQRQLTTERAETDPKVFTKITCISR
jgi:hypothetical protein